VLAKIELVIWSNIYRSKLFKTMSRVEDDIECLTPWWASVIQNREKAIVYNHYESVSVYLFTTVVTMGMKTLIEYRFWYPQILWIWDNW
jgi:hypothetical protein